MKQINFLSLISKAGIFAIAMGVLLLSSCTEKVDPADTTSPEAAFTYTADELVVSFVNTSKGASADAPYAWTFEGGDPASSTAEGTAEEPIVVTFPAAGTYKVTLTANRANGKSDTIERVVTVSKLPVAEFSYTAVGRTITFINESANAEFYTWNFGDGSALSTEENPVYRYGSNETYTVKLTAQGGAIIAEKEMEIVVSGPIAGFTYTLNDKTITLTNTSDLATSYKWDLGDGTASEEENPADHEYADYGDYNIELVAIDDNGGTDTLVTTVTVVPLPTAAFTYAGDGLAFTYTNASTDASSYMWDFGDGNTSTDENPTHQYSAAGVYRVRLIATNDFDISDKAYAWYGVAATGTPYATFINGDLDGYGLEAQRTDKGCTEDCISPDEYQDNNDAWEKPDHWTGDSGFRAGGMSSDGKKDENGDKTNGLKMKDNNTRGAYQEVIVEVGKEYTVSFDVAGDEVASTDVRLNAYVLNARINQDSDVAAGNTIAHFAVNDTELTGKGNFVTKSITFTATTTTVTFYMLETEFTNGSSSEVWVDNIFLVKNN